jgi:prevent-host-death family protein
MKAITSTEANREFSKLLRAVAQGQSIQITSRGRPVATLSPIDSRGLKRRAAGKAGLLARLDRQPIGGGREWSRDELYD